MAKHRTICVMAGLALAAGLGPRTAYAVEAPVLQPSGPWQVDYADNECRLLRPFGTGNRSLTLRMARGASLNTFDMVLAGPGIPKLPKRLTISLRLEPQGVAQSIDGYSLAIPKAPGRFVRWFDASSELIDRFEANQQIAISSGPAFTSQLNLTEAKAAMGALDECYSDLLKGWGIDPAQNALVVVRPKPVGGTGGSNTGTVTAMRAGAARPSGMAGWATSMDYPTEALRQEIGGTVVMALALDTTGRVQSCRVVLSSKFEPLDTRSCKVLTDRARYTPALDAKGDVVPATVIERIRWVIPDD